MFHCCALLFIFFFFQAKEGIRFDCVTGFQKCLFFFSSRRRHTRSLCDWSSDVCSSDHTVISYAVFCLKSEEHTSELQSHSDLVYRLLLETGKQAGGGRPHPRAPLTNRYHSGTSRSPHP